jgi:hypothetical protein
MRGWLNDDFLAKLPDDLRACIVVARKWTNNKRGSDNRSEFARNDAVPVTATEDRLWLLAMTEVYGKLLAQTTNVPRSTATYDAEGAQYKLYTDSGVSTKNYAFCARAGVDNWWWLRSPHALDTSRFLGVGFDGGWRDGYADCVWGVYSCFCL